MGPVVESGLEQEEKRAVDRKKKEKEMKKSVPKDKPPPQLPQYKDQGGPSSGHSRREDALRARGDHDDEEPLTLEEVLQLVNETEHKLWREDPAHDSNMELLQSYADLLKLATTDLTYNEVRQGLRKFLNDEIRKKRKREGR